jgi:hypothetical protein
MKTFPRSGPSLLIGALLVFSVGAILRRSLAEEESVRTVDPRPYHLLIKQPKHYNDLGRFKDALNLATADNPQAPKPKRNPKWYRLQTDNDDPQDTIFDGQLDSCPKDCDIGAIHANRNVTQQIAFQKTEQMVTFLNTAFN